MAMSLGCLIVSGHHWKAAGQSSHTAVQLRQHCIQALLALQALLAWSGRFHQA